MTGKLLIGQAGGATAVINSSLVGIIQAAQHSEQFDAIWGMRRAAEGALHGDLLDLTNLREPQLRSLSRTPGAALISSRHKLIDDEVEQLLDVFRRNDVRAFLYIGGNDSADSIHRLARLAADRHQDVSCIAVPKTIDNDLPLTDHSPGYGSIARYVAIAAMDSAKDTESMPTMYPVKFIEVMGRDAGWVAAASTLAKCRPGDAPHLVYVPERPVSPAGLLNDVRRVYSEFGRVVAVVTETMRDENGHPFADPSLSSENDAFGHPLLRGTADAMCRLVQSELGLRCRYDKPGSLQRMSMLTVSAVDLEEAGAAGAKAVELALRGESDRMVIIVRDSDDPYRAHMDSAPLEEIANRQWLLPDEFLTSDGRHTTAAFTQYALPLLGPDPFPEYARLDAPRVTVQ